MVAPKDKSLSCVECHAKNGRLAKLTGFYMPGRDASAAVDLLGSGAVAFTFFGVLGHGALRIIRRKKQQ